MAKKMETKHYNIKVTGRVQGVWFRQYTLEKAKELGLLGFVRNESDGSVYIEAEGEPVKLDALIIWLYTGSPMSKVMDVNVSQGVLKDFKDFKIKR